MSSWRWSKILDLLIEHGGAKVNNTENSCQLAMKTAAKVDLMPTLHVILITKLNDETSCHLTYTPRNAFRVHRKCRGGFTSLSQNDVLIEKSCWCRGAASFSTSPQKI